MDTPKNNPNISITRFICTLSQKERLDWLIARQIVLEPVINKIKMYIVHRPSSTGESQVLAAQTEAQSEYIRNQAEIEVLTDFLSKQQ